MITVEGLHYRYAGAESEAVRGIDFAVEPGEIFGFLGPSGAGKSTTQKVLIGLLAEYRGTAEVLDRQVSEWGPQLYERIGVSFELPNHFSKLTGRENLDYFARLYEAETRPADELLEAVGLADAGDVRAGDYSKGMKNRLGVARSMLHRPGLLFLDEPTAGLDPVSARVIRQLVRAQRDAGSTVFLTTHDMITADEICDRVALIVDGRLAAVDRPRDLKLRYGKRVVRVETERGGKRASAEFPIDGIGDNAEFLALLADGGVETIHTQEATLEQAFVEATGQALA